MSSTAPSSRPVRSLVLTAKLKDTSNASTPELSFQRKAVQDFRARQLEGQASLPASNAEDPPRPPLKARSSLSRSHTSLSTASSPPQKRTVDLTTDDSDGGDERGMQYVFVSNNVPLTHIAFVFTVRKRCATATTMSETSSVVIDDDVELESELESSDSDDIQGEYSRVFITVYLLLLLS